MGKGWARRKTNTQPPPVENRRFTPEAIDSGIQKLTRRIEEVTDLDPSKVRHDDQSVANVTLRINETLREVFGSDHSPKFVGFVLTGMSDAEHQDEFAEEIPQTVTMLKGRISFLEEKRECLGADQEVDQSGATSLVQSSANTRQVFVVHGRDDAAKHQVRTFLNELGLEPVILDEQPNDGQTVIEKFEGNADVGFAVVLLTPDDTGGLADSSNKSRPRARQNVIFELGFFVGKLGRKKVCVLRKGDVEIASDYQGVIYVHMDDDGGWKLKLAKELNNTGIDVDLNQLQ